MSYAIRNDGTSWRAVASAADCDQDETWSATHPTIPMPEIVDAPPQLTEAQAAKLIAFLKANPDIVEAAQL